MPRRTVVGIAVAMILVAVPSVAVGQASGPAFTGPFQDEYLGNELIEASGTGCPATGGAPSATAPGVFVSLDDVADSSLQVSIGVENGLVTFTPDTDYPESGGLYAPLDLDGSWTLQIEAEFGSPPYYELEGFCTTLIELADDGESIDPASLERARFTSPPFLLVATPLPGPPDSTTTTEPSTTSSAPTTSASTTAAPRPAATSPRFTG